MASNQKMQENKPTLKFNFTIEKRWPVSIFELFGPQRLSHWALLYILQRQQSNDIGCIRSVQGLILFYWLLGICNSGLERYFALQPCSLTPSWWHHKIPLSILSFSLCIICIPSKSSWMHQRRHRKVFYRPGICSSGVMHCLTQKYEVLQFGFCAIISLSPTVCIAWLKSM